MGAMARAASAGGDAIQAEPRTLAVHPFQLGKRAVFPDGPQGNSAPHVCDVLFTMRPGSKRFGKWPQLFAEIGISSGAKESIEGDQLLLVLYDAAGRPLHTFSAPVVVETADGGPQPRQVSMELGRSRFLRETRYWTLSRIGNAPPVGPDATRDEESVRHLAGREKLPVAAYPFKLSEQLVVDIAPEKQESRIVPGVWEKKRTRIPEVRFEKNSNSELLLKMRIESKEQWTKFNAAVAAVLLDEQNSMIAAHSRIVPVYVGNKPSATAEVVLNLGKLAGAQRAQRIVLGLSTKDTGHWHGSFMGTFIDFSPLFPFEQMLAADDPRVWKTGLAELSQALHREMIKVELSHPRDHQRNVSLGLTRQKKLAPHLGRLEAILKLTGDPEGLALLCRLAGLSGEKRLIELLARRLEDPRPMAQDAAAVGLGLLGDGRGLKRLAPILQRPAPQESHARQALNDYQDEVRLAIVSIESAQVKLPDERDTGHQCLSPDSRQ
jgi:hypothetical protein